MNTARLTYTVPGATVSVVITTGSERNARRVPLRFARGWLAALGMERDRIERLVRAQRGI